MVVAHGEVDIGLAARTGIECRLDEMLLHRRARAVGIVVEEEQPLGQLSVAQPLAFEQEGHDGLVFAGGKQGLKVFALGGPTAVVERVAEGEMPNVVEEPLLKVGGGHVVGGLEKGEKILEHAAGRPRSRHKLHDAVALGLIRLPRLDVDIALGGLRSHDACTDGCRPFEPEKGETGLELRQLPLHLRFGDAVGGNLFKVLLIQHISNIYGILSQI